VKAKPSQQLASRFVTSTTQGYAMPNYPRTRKAKQSQRLAAVADPESGLPKLTAKQERFALELLSGKSAREAYRLAYDCSQCSEATVIAHAFKATRNAQIALFIRLHQRIGLENAAISRDSHLAELARLRELAVENQQVSAGVQAEHYRGRVAGLYNDKLTLAVGPSDDVILSQLAAILGHESAEAIGEALGVKRGSTVILEATGDSQTLALPSPLESPPHRDNDIDLP
jgi:hypothetical protein